MRSLAFVAVLLLAGCLQPAPPKADPAELGSATLPPALSCQAPCEVPVLVGPGKSFEPDVAVNPLDPDHVVIAETPIRGEPGGVTYRSLSVYVSRDGGQTWQTTWTSETAVASPMHPLRGCLLIGDAVTAFLPDGGVLVGGMAGTDVLTLSLFVMRSDDGGATFPHLAWVDRATPMPACGGEPVPPAATPRRSTDKPDLAVGPDGTAMISWHRLGLGTLSDATGFHVSYSSDRGNSWSPPRRVVPGDGITGASMHVFNASHQEMATQGPGSAVTFFFTHDQGIHWYFTKVADTNNQFPSFTAIPTETGFVRVVGFSQPSGSDRHAPALAVFGDGGGFTFVPLEPASAQYPMIALDADAHGTVFVSYWTPGEGGDRIHRRVAAWRDGILGAAVTLDRTPAERHDMTPVGYGHYQSLAAFPGGAYAVWGAGPQAAADLFSATVRIEPASY